MLTPLHFWLVFFGTGVLFVFLAYWGGRWRRLNPKEVAQDDGPAGCAHCGYDVRGLPSDICPECGSDLNEVGRLAPRYRQWQKVPPVLRAIVYTGGVGMAAMLLIISAAGLSGIYLLPPFVAVTHIDTFTTHHWHPTLVNAAGVPLRYEVVQTGIVEEFPNFAEGGMSSTVVSHIAVGRFFFSQAARGRPADHLRIEVDLLGPRWRAIDGRTGREIDSDDGYLSVEAAHRLVTDFARARAANFGRETTLTVRNNDLIPLSAATTPPDNPYIASDWTALDQGEISLWQAAQVAADLDMPRAETRPDITAIFGHDDPNGSRWNGTSAGGGRATRVPLLTWLWLIGFWLLVLLVGLWFVTRRREIRGTGRARLLPSRLEEPQAVS